jgi:hypothetical protein
MSSIVPLWEAGRELACTDPTARKLFTYIPGQVPNLFGGTAFSQTNIAKIQPYFGVKDTATWQYLGDTQTNRAANLINYVQGYDSGYIINDVANFSMRTRTLNTTCVDPVTGISSTGPRPWKLGDIVHSTPVTVASPPGLYGITYQDRLYQDYYNLQITRSDRENMVYVGANDGMLHAFTSWQYDSVNKAFNNPDSLLRPFEQIGSELWAYLPNALLPHLKWLPANDYGENHVYYVDLPPQILDVQIFYNILGDNTTAAIDDGFHKNGYGTILVGGMRFGGKKIDVTDDFDYNGATADTTQSFTSSYFAIDISNPRSPKILWEKTYDDLAFTTTEPRLVKLGQKWLLTFGSGPEEYDGTSTQTSKFFVVDLATGNPYKNASGDVAHDDWLFQGAHNDAFIGGLNSLDYLLNFSVEGTYFTETYDDSPHGWKGNMYKITFPGDIPKDPLHPDYATAFATATNPANWYLTKIFASSQPFTAPPMISTDRFKNVWLYAGTGRYLNEADKVDVNDQFLYGFKDPYYNKKLYELAVAPDDFFLNDSNNKLLSVTDLFASSAYKVIYPWGSYEAPVGDCSAVPTGQIGDIYNDASCICDYDWPDSECTEVTVGSCALAGITMGQDIFDDGDCVCLPYQKPVWGCVASTIGACDTVPPGYLDTTADYKSLFWKCTGDVDTSCDGVAFGTVGAGLGDGTCNCQEIDPVAVPAPWSCDTRPVGDCSTATWGDEGDLLGDQSCLVGYWTCEATDTIGYPTACSDGAGHSVDYTLTTGFLGPLGDGDYFSDGSCTCHFVAEPEAIAINTLANFGLDFDAMVDLARLEDGWFRTTEEPGERIVTQPGVIGGIALFTSYVPSADQCSFGGNSYLWGLYYETGTAYSDPVFDNETVFIDGKEQVVYRIHLGYGMASSVTIHVGQEAGGDVTGYAQSSSGAISIKNINPAFNVRSGMSYWRQN